LLLLVAPQQLDPIDIIVLGSVAVNRVGVRIGKGAGYSDIEFALLTEAGLISPDTLIVTTVHALQVIEEPIPSTEHDVTVDLIITPDEVIRTPKSIARQAFSGITSHLHRSPRFPHSPYEPPGPMAGRANAPEKRVRHCGT
jgi:hypothetical protein